MRSHLTWFLSNFFYGLTLGGKAMKLNRAVETTSMAGHLIL